MQRAEFLLSLTKQFLVGEVNEDALCNFYHTYLPNNGINDCARV